ncbi:L-histidine N(alpha)-methyltransferase [Streptomyces rapamycinicus]|uniref:L-histidine N(Alpha)-methyltransferase n=1 Tax=Streptomyces rhizosphaericus TaxID=114699 RepID=A0A6G4AW56_9ACTN|nr:L-histidine N(alpha)-methyltransferase [Streptomyces rhizosphaericus]
MVASTPFYRGGGASSIMRVANFPDEIFPFLQMEGLEVLDIASRYNCDVLVELGCYDGRALEVAKAAGIEYVGVDLSVGGIQALDRRITDEGLQRRARAICGDILSCEEWMPAVSGRRPLILLPFNLIGNFADPVKVLASLSESGGVIVISVFNEAETTTELRHAYYVACGIDIHTVAASNYGGTAFFGDKGFQSQSFSGRGLADLVDAVDADVVHDKANRIGRCVALRFRRRSVPS